MSGEETMFVSVAEDRMGIVIGTGGCNIKRIQLETRTRIVKKQDEKDQGPGFIVTGTKDGCEEAKRAIECSVVSIQSLVVDRL